MENKALNAEQLNIIPHDVIVQMYLQQAESYKTLLDQNSQLMSQNAELIRKVGTLEENIRVLNYRLFGRKTEKIREMTDGKQLKFNFDLDDPLAFNEAEVLVEDGMPEEPEIETVIIHRRKPKGKRKEDLSHVDEVTEDRHELSEEKLAELFPNGYDRLKDEGYSDIEYQRAKFVRHDHIIAVYAGKNGEGIVKAERPERLLKNSILTPSLAAAIFNCKYANAMPLNRVSEEFERCNIRISRQDMAGWMIKITERYLGPYMRKLHSTMMGADLIHGDETPFTVVQREEGQGLQSYMWVYHTYDRFGVPPIFIYDYHKGRDSSIPREFLKDFKGVLVTDGYQVYHKVANERPDELQVAGCWEHAKRKFAELVKSIDKKSHSGSIAAEAVKRITAIYHVDNMGKDMSDAERLEHRQRSVKPLVDAYFDWLGNIETATMDKGGNLYRAITYSLNQEPYLRVFLDNPIVPTTNNDAERSIKKFCVGKHSWHIIATKKGAQSSAVLYSIAETARANGLKPFEYFQFLLEQILAHLDDPPEDYLDDIMPWSDKIPAECRKIEFKYNQEP
jgi:transposase